MAAEMNSAKKCVGLNLETGELEKPVPAGGSAAASSSSAAAYVPYKDRAPIPEQMFTKAEAAIFLPQAVGCVIAINKGKTWEVKYSKKADPPRSHSSTFVVDDASSCAQALKEVLRWAWTAHEVCDPTASCPWDLDAALDVEVEDAAPTGAAASSSS